MLPNTDQVSLSYRQRYRSPLPRQRISLSVYQLWLSDTLHGDTVHRRYTCTRASMGRCRVLARDNLIFLVANEIVGFQFRSEIHSINAVCSQPSPEDGVRYTPLFRLSQLCQTPSTPTFSLPAKSHSKIPRPCRGTEYMETRIWQPLVTGWVTNH